MSYHKTEDSVMESNYFGFKLSSDQISDLQLKRYVIFEKLFNTSLKVNFPICAMCIINTNILH